MSRAGVTYVWLDDGVGAGSLERRRRACVAQRDGQGERHVAGSALVWWCLRSLESDGGWRLSGFVEKGERPSAMGIECEVPPCWAAAASFPN